MKIISVGKISKSYVEQGIGAYSKRLQGGFKIKWEIIPYSGLKSPQAALKQESDRIIGKIQANDFVILLDQTGKNLSSPELSQVLTSRSNVVIVIGGAYGVDQVIFERANLVWSLSRLVFPHQLVRLILTEQIYRAQTIAQNHPYHH